MARGHSCHRRLNPDRLGVDRGRSGWLGDCEHSAWGVQDALSAWFGANIGKAGYRHYGIFDGDRLVSTGAMFVTGKTAWLGFGATLPDFQGQGMQTATMAHRINVAVDMGCNLLHTETSAGSPSEPNPSLLNMVKLGFHRIYDKAFYGPAPAEAG